MEVRCYLGGTAVAMAKQRSVFDYKHKYNHLEGELYKKDGS
jgi:hypothetical protein